MTRPIAMLAAAAALAAFALPAAAADLYGYGGDRPQAFYDRGELGPGDDGFRDDGEGFARRGGPGPVVFDERHRSENRDVFEAGRGPEYLPPPRPSGRPDGFGPGPGGFEAGYGGFRPAPSYRPAAAPAGPAFGEGYGVPDGGCTVERARSITPAGWQKTVTRRICYRR